MVKKQPSSGTNEITEESTRPFVEKIDSFEAELLSEKGSYMARCRSLKDAIKEVYEEASSSGIRRPSLKAAMKRAGLVRKINTIDLTLEADAKEVYDQLNTVIEGMEGLPLGDAALQREAKDRDNKKLGRRRASPTVEALAEGPGAVN